MKYRQLYFLEHRLIAEAPRNLVRVHETLAPPTSDLYFCPHCGEVWARLPVLNDKGATTKWQSFRHTCRKCAEAHVETFVVAGSIWRSWDLEFNLCLPASVLSWELERHLDHFERI